jgi:hypothetical protein
VPELTADQTREEHLRVLGPVLGEVYHALWHETVWLHFTWKQYLTLFAQPQEGVDELNAAAPAFFFVVQNTLWEHVLLSIARLTGPPKSKGQDNLTVQGLPALVPDAAFGGHLGSMLATREPIWASATKWRHKRLAHHDLDVALGRAEPLPGVSRDDVEAALAALRAVLNAVARKYLGGEVAYDLRTPAPDAYALLHFLRLGLRSDQERQARLRAGNPLATDLK